MIFVVATITAQPVLSLAEPADATAVAPKDDTAKPPGAENGQPSRAAPSSEDIERKKKLAKAFWEAGRWTEAAEIYTWLYTNLNDPLFLWNVGKCLEVADASRSIEAYTQYRPHADAEQQSYIDAFIAEQPRRVEPQPVRPVVTPSVVPTEAPIKASHHTATAPSGTSESLLATDIAGYSLLAVGAGALGFGGYWAFRAANSKDDADSLCEGGICTSDARNIVAYNENHVTYAGVLLGTGLVAIATGIYFAWLQDEDPGLTHAFLDFQPSPGGGELTLSGEF